MSQKKEYISGLIFGALGVTVSMLGFVSATTMNIAKYDQLLYASNAILSLFLSLTLMLDSMHSLVLSGKNGTHIHG
ncbi:MAG: hypothetical protein JHC26_01520 [Thermofilum sp.]|jgi:hypothetical protein|uniref:hypothetical protein n=1 Tax=Thermofilum sp. TaxID=1961369 RepID=UPI00258C6332|nr:hypothetical protein [Thermofilum sp.]MCI4407740.1 hypothetical protein [Thermofilum sp.]